MWHAWMTLTMSSSETGPILRMRILVLTIVGMSGIQNSVKQVLRQNYKQVTLTMRRHLRVFVTLEQVLQDQRDVLAEHVVRGGALPDLP